jgi:hypothetical protein
VGVPPDPGQLSVELVELDERDAWTNYQSRKLAQQRCAVGDASN